MTDEETVQKWKATIDGMTHLQMAKLYRFAPCGHCVFQRGELNDYFMKKFNAAGGMTPDISKRIGWADTEGLTEGWYE
jgi:hypothetical protein